MCSYVGQENVMKSVMKYECRPGRGSVIRVFVIGRPCFGKMQIIKRYVTKLASFTFFNRAMRKGSSGDGKD